MSYAADSVRNASRRKPCKPTFVGVSVTVLRRTPARLLALAGRRYRINPQSIKRQIEVEFKEKTKEKAPKRKS